MIVENNNEPENKPNFQENINSKGTENTISNGTNPEEFRPWGMEKKQFLTLMHLSQLAGYFVVAIGFVLPVVMWLMYRDQDADIDRHGKEITNFLISMCIYLTISFFLAFIFIGFFFMFGLIIANIIFSIMGAMKAQDGILYRYPMTIRFFK